MTGHRPSPLAGEVGALAPGGGIRASNTVTGTTAQLTAGRHVVRLTGLSSDSLVRWIDVVPAHGGQAKRQWEERSTSDR